MGIGDLMGALVNSFDTPGCVRMLLRHTLCSQVISKLTQGKFNVVWQLTSVLCLYVKAFYIIHTNLYPKVGAYSLYMYRPGGALV